MSLIKLPLIDWTESISFTIFSHITSSGNGCCDCGDSQAWRNDIKCKKHPAIINRNYKNYISLLPKELTSSMNKTVCALLDFVAETITESPSTKTAPNYSSVLEANFFENEEESKAFKMITEEHQYEFGLVLWNDEHHSFNEVISQV